LRGRSRIAEDALGRVAELVGDLLDDDCGDVAGGSLRLDVDVGAGGLERDLALQREFGVRYKIIDVSAQLDVPRGVCRVGDHDREAKDPGAGCGASVGRPRG
jgi:hypothetical protein